jgi:hypothetical protein
VGRAFIAIRDRDVAASVMGVSLFHYKLLAFVISSFYAGVAGGLMAHHSRIVFPIRSPCWCPSTTGHDHHRRDGQHPGRFGAVFMTLCRDPELSDVADRGVSAGLRVHRSTRHRLRPGRDLFLMYEPRGWRHLAEPRILKLWPYAY